MAPSIRCTLFLHTPEDQEYGWSAEVLRAAGEYVAQADITLALEALNRFECYLCNTMEQLGRLVKMANHPTDRNSTGKRPPYIHHFGCAFAHGYFIALFIS